MYQYYITEVRVTSERLPLSRQHERLCQRLLQLTSLEAMP